MVPKVDKTNVSPSWPHVYSFGNIDNKIKQHIPVFSDTSRGIKDKDQIQNAIRVLRKCWAVSEQSQRNNHTPSQRNQHLDKGSSDWLLWEDRFTSQGLVDNEVAHA